MKILYSILTMFFAFHCFSQSLMQVALENKPVIIAEDAFLLQDHLINGDFSESGVDKSLLADLRLQAKNERQSKWRSFDLATKMIVQGDNEIDIDRVLALSPNLNATEKVNLKIDIKHYNSKVGEWRKFPLHVSRPIYSTQKDYAVIGFIYGNDGGEISLYHLENSQWKLERVLGSWVY